MLRNEIHRHMITLAPWDHHVLTVWNCVHQWFGNGGKMHCWLGLMGGTPALQQKNSFHFVHLTLEAYVDMSMLIGEKTVKRKGLQKTLQESLWDMSRFSVNLLARHLPTYQCGLPTRLFRNRYNPTEKHNKSANPPAVRVVTARQDVFLKGRLHEACVLSDDSFYITTTWGERGARDLFFVFRYSVMERPQTNLDHWTSPKKHTQVSR